MIPLKTIEDLIGKHALLEKDLSLGSVDKKTFAEKSKEYSDLNEIIDNAKKYISYESDKSELQKILDDKNSDEELRKMAETELNDLDIENEKNENSEIKLNPYDNVPLHRKLIDKKNSKVGVFDLGNHILIIGFVLIVIFVTLNVD